MSEPIINPWRLKWYSIAVLCGIFLSMVIALFSGAGAEIITGRLGGDFPPFYAAGRIVSTIGFEKLYDLGQQIEIQKDLYPTPGGFLPFPYPPFVALAFVPFSFLTFREAYLLNVLLNIGALFLAIVCLRSALKLKGYLLPTFTVTLTFFPVWVAIFKGQNFAITALLFSLVWMLINKGRPYLAGISMGMLFYKPQFAIPLIGLFLISGRVKTALSGTAIGLILFLSGYAYFGLLPYEQWYNFLKWFGPADAIINKHNAISWIGFLDGIFGPEHEVAKILGYGLCIATVGSVAYVWFEGNTRSDFNAQMGIAAISILLIPPHVMYYDSGLVLFSLAVVLSRMDQRKERWICIVWLFAAAQGFAVGVGFSPIFILVVVSYIACLAALSSPAMGKASVSATRPLQSSQ
jgi:alpha-1,2-mannosyltransferase